ncbi:MAG: V-type ATP synthase subunit E [Clostridia bacterium]|nr:V-type ATP synthase subunit E [Clostridia bacterium]
MGGPEKIKEKIIDEAREKADQITGKAKKKADEMMEKAQQQADKKKNDILNKAKEDAEQRKERIMSVAQLEMKKDILSAKQDMIQKSFDEVLNKIQSLEKSRYQDILLGMFLDNVQTGEEEVIISSSDVDRLDNEFIDRVNAELVKTGKKGKLKLSEEKRDIRGGFILKSGGIEINSSFEAMIRMEKEKIEPEIAQILFK